MGLILGCYVSAANGADSKAAPAVLVPVLELYQRIEKILADQGYQGEQLAKQVELADECVLKWFNLETNRRALASLQNHYDGSSRELWLG